MMVRVFLGAATAFFMFSSSVGAAEFFKASSYCSIAKVTGYSGYDASRQSALDTAIQQCTQKGGVPSCCRSGAKITDIKVFYAATSHCSRTGATGKAVMSTFQEAKDYAVARCVGNGGIVACCRNDIVVK